ncbi:putative ribonuclease H-like domain-containing protein [Tanacetum coccineum]
MTSSMTLNPGCYTKVVRKNDDAPCIKEWVSDDEEEDVSQPKTEKKTVRPSIVKKEFVDCKYPQKQFQNQRMVKPVWNNAQKVNHQNFAKKTHPYAKKNLVPRAVLMKSGLVSVNTARQVNAAHSKTTVNAARPMSYLSKTTHSTVKRLIHKNTTFKNNNINQRVNSVLFNDTECIVLSLNFKLINECQVLLRVPRKNNMYSVDLKNIVPKGGLTCLFAKATSDESKLCYRRLGHLKFKTMNKLVKGNLVRGLPYKLFENDQTCVACQKGKQHRASCKSNTENSISLPLHLLHMDLFGLTFVKSLMKKMYCLVVIDDYSRFTWVFFLDTKDETSRILKSFITEIENLVDHKVKVVRCDNGTEFKNRENESVL